MRAIAKLLVLSACLGLAAPAWAAHTLSLAEQRVLSSWLAKHPKYRLATDSDCNCADDIKQMKSGYGGNWKPVADYHPYVATGDFNSDGVEDFAVAVIDRTKQKDNFVLIVFNGPSLPTTELRPAFLKSGLDLSGQGLFYGPPRPKPYRLVIGSFESEGWVLVPNGHGYKLSGS